MINRSTLWDGSKQLHGQLILTKDGVVFHFHDFASTNLNLKIDYGVIASVRLYRVYEVSLKGIEIVTKEGDRNVFITEDAIKLVEQIRDKKKITSCIR